MTTEMKELGMRYCCDEKCNQGRDCPRRAETTHSEECWRWHHECAIAEIERKRKPLTDEQISDLWHQSGEQPFKFARMLVK